MMKEEERKEKQIKEKGAVIGKEEEGLSPERRCM